MKRNNSWSIIVCVLIIVFGLALIIAYVRAVWATDLPWFIKLRLM